ncbi:MAG TPA: Mur ligase family protein, partial [Acidobacteriota bacterium]|nr:Mur ligase family protein [Acidobacteriota bacterium]
LEKLGICPFPAYDPANLSAARPDLVIPGNAIPRGNPELEEALNTRLPYWSMAEAIRNLFLRDKTSIVIAGTHGKTTTSAMVAWLLESAGMHPSFLVGGIPLNFGQSFQWKAQGKFFVIEGDEYDTGFMDRRPKFVHYSPEIVVLNAVEYDHADLYPNFDAVRDAFRQLIKIVPGNGTLIANRDSQAGYELAKNGYSKVISFGFHPESDVRVDAEKWENGVVSFRIDGQPCVMRVFGKHNLANAAATFIVGKQIGMDGDQIRAALQTFQGVKRRMELRGERNGIEVYDDFAHHPTAIRVTLEGARLAFPDARIWGIFEPRSWSSRRNIFQKQFAESFDCSDVAVIAGVHEPEKLPQEIRLDPQQLVADLNKRTEAHYIPQTEQIVEFVAKNARAGDKLILMSNGSFNGLHDRILDRLE